MQASSGNTAHSTSGGQSDPHLVVIANPSAKLLGAEGYAPEQIAANLRSRGFAVDIYTEDSAEQTVARSEAVAWQGVAAIVALGGDGTIHSIVEGLLRARQAGAAPTVLGIIPAGTMNNVALALGISESLDSALDVIAAGVSEGMTRTLDVGLVERNVFVEVSSMGMEAELLPIGEEVKVRPWELPRAFFIMLQMAQHARPTRVTLEVDERRTTMRALGVTICNTPTYGARFLVAPDAQPDDGQLDVVVFTGKTGWALLRHLFETMGGKRRSQVDIQRFRGRVVRVRPSHAWAVHMDGTHFMAVGRGQSSAALEASAWQAALTVCAPPKSGDNITPEGPLHTAFRVVPTDHPR
ncbi:MAG TPA: diacylglycerol kinase family protein [Ktedonobacterales bacterium]|nr:diacylglycerol kinase family protein [Ktedonobacterales bacterium]